MFAFFDCLRCQFYCTRTLDQWEYKESMRLDMENIRVDGRCLYFNGHDDSESPAATGCIDLDRCRVNCTNANIMYLLASNQAESRISLDWNMSPLIWTFVLCMVLTTLGMAGNGCLTNTWCYTILGKTVIQTAVGERIHN